MKNKIILSLLFLSITSCVNAMQNNSNDMPSLTLDPYFRSQNAPGIKPKKVKKNFHFDKDIQDERTEKQRQKEKALQMRAARALKWGFETN